MTLEEYIRKVMQEKDRHPEWRWGQTYFNVLAEVNMGLAQNMFLTGADPFYSDDRVPSFLGALYRYFETFGSVKDERPSSNT